MREILKAAFQTGGAAVLSMILNVITIKVMAMALGPEGTGLYSVLIQIYTTALALATLGGASALVQGVASRQGQAQAQYLATTGWLFGVGMISAICILIAFSPQIAYSTTGKSDEITVGLVRWLAIPVGVGVVFVYFSSIMNGFRAIGRLASIKVAGAGATAALAYPVAQWVYAKHFVAFIWLLSIPVLLQVVLSLVSVLRAGWLDRLVGNSSRLFQRDAAYHFFSIAFVMLIVGQISSVAFLAINSLIVQDYGLAGGGIFNAAWNLSIQYVMLILTSFGTYFLPTLSRIDEEGERTKLLSNIARLTTIAMIPLVTALIVLKPLVITALYSAEYLESLTILRWMLIGDYLKISSWVVAMPVLAYADMKTFLWTETAWVVGLLLLSILTIKVFHSLQGIGIAFQVLYAAYLGYYLSYTRKRHQFVVPSHILKTWFIGFGIVVAASVYTWNHLSIDWTAPVWIGVAIGASWLALSVRERGQLVLALKLRLGTSG